MSRENYDKITVDCFLKATSESLEIFKKNMDKLKMENMSFPEWAEIFLAWMEVNTGVEEECYGPGSSWLSEYYKES